MSVSLGCNTQPGESLPQAYIAPASVNLRAQPNQKNSTVATLSHGEQVNILDVRRRFAKVRTSRGAEGWLDSLDLLSPEEMDRIKRERAADLRLPSEGSATAYENLNIHIDPDRRSPAFAQIPEGGLVSVLGRAVEPRVTPAPQPWLTSIPKPRPQSRRQRKTRVAKNSSKQPPMPLPPGPPKNWTALWGSESRAESAEHATDPQGMASSRSSSAKAEKPPVMDAWTLVRTKNNQTGWVLSHSLMMSIPDEVAQYAAGRHITSYFDLGKVNDEREGPKHNWLWTTASEGETLDFDSWRVFLWNRRHHRYETSYRQHDVEGYFPVRVEPQEQTAFGRQFSLITKDEDGKFRRRTYLFDGTLVHLVRTEDYSKSQEDNSNKADAGKSKSQQQSQQQGSWLRRKWLALKQRFSAKT